MTLRRINLDIGRRPSFHADDKGDASPRLILHGRTESGGEYEIVLRVDGWHLGALACDIRDHFVAQAEREKSQRAHRERALRMPPEAQ